MRRMKKVFAWLGALVQNEIHPYYQDTKVVEHIHSLGIVAEGWNLQNGVVVIPGSSNPEHIRENMRLYDFELTAKEMAAIMALNRNEKHDWY